MLNTPRHLFLVLSLALSLGATATLRAGTASFPKDKPLLTVEVPKDWETTYLASSGGMQVSQTMVGQITFLPVPDDAGVTDAETAKASLVKLVTAYLESMGEKPSKCSDPVETTVAGNKAYTTTTTGAMGNTEMTIFTPNGETYFLLKVLDDGKKLISTIKAVQ